MDRQAELKRACCNCGREITACNGFVKVGDLMNPDGTINWQATHARELCNVCVEIGHWTEAGEFLTRAGCQHSGQPTVKEGAASIIRG